jgi:hypothetical protein
MIHLFSVAPANDTRRVAQVQLSTQVAINANRGSLARVERIHDQMTALKRGFADAFECLQREVVALQSALEVRAPMLDDFATALLPVETADAAAILSSVAQQEDVDHQ